jgi:hypothetical protein
LGIKPFATNKVRKKSSEDDTELLLGDAKRDTVKGDEWDGGSKE